MSVVTSWKKRKVHWTNMYHNILEARTPRYNQNTCAGRRRDPVLTLGSPAINTIQQIQSLLNWTRTAIACSTFTWHKLYAIVKGSPKILNTWSLLFFPGQNAKQWHEYVQVWLSLLKAARTLEVVCNDQTIAWSQAKVVMERLCSHTTCPQINSQTGFLQ